MKIKTLQNIGLINFEKIILKLFNYPKDDEKWI